MEKGCNSCANYKHGKIHFNKEDTPHSCSILTNKEQHDSWWKNNGHKKPNEPLDDMPCFKETFLGELLKEASDILEKIKESYDKKDRPLN